MINRFNKALKSIKEKITHYLGNFKYFLSLVISKFKKTPKRKVALATYFAVLVVILAVISLGIWPGAIMPEKEIPMEKEDKDEDEGFYVIEEDKEVELETVEDTETETSKNDFVKEGVERMSERHESEQLEKEEEENEEEKDEVVVTSLDEIPAVGVWPAEGEVITEHNEVYQVNNQYKIHKGIDIRVPKGTEVKAPWDGQIKEVEEKAGMGKIIFIQHEGFVSKYGNLKESLFQDGDYVTAGEEIALVGDDAKLDAAKGSFLHFAVYSEKGYFDPLKLLN